MNIFKRVLNYFFPEKKKQLSVFDKIEQAKLSATAPTEPAKPIIPSAPEKVVPKPIKQSKQKEEKIHRIEPDYSCAPKTFYFSKSKSLQQIFFWDGEHFPGRWRHKIIHH